MKGRIDRIAQEPSLESVAFDHVAIIDKTSGSASVANLDRLTEIGQDPTAFKPPGLEQQRTAALRAVIFESEPVIEERIRSFAPDLVLLRGGTIFEAEMGAFLQMVINVRTQHGNLPFALDGGQEWLDRTRGDDVPWGFEGKAIQARRRYIANEFVHDEDAEHLCTAIFAPDRGHTSL